MHKTNHLLLTIANYELIRGMLMLRTILAFSFRLVMELRKASRLLLTITNSPPIKGMLLLRTILASSFKMVLELHKTNHLLLTSANSPPIKGILLLRTDSESSEWIGMGSLRQALRLFGPQSRGAIEKSNSSFQFCDSAVLHSLNGSFIR
jgi:hypothetical protein